MMRQHLMMRKLNIIMKEYYIALWGNGIDAINNYRRTGKPDNMQFTRTAAPGSFTRSMLYPANLVNLNLNALKNLVLMYRYSGIIILLVS